MADTISFSSTMTKISSNIKKEDVYVCFTLKVVEDTSVRTFPGQTNDSQSYFMVLLRRNS